MPDYFLTNSTTTTSNTSWASNAFWATTNTVTTGSWSPNSVYIIPSGTWGDTWEWRPQRAVEQTPAQRRAQARRAREREESQRELEVAKATAIELLHSLLSDEQRDELERLRRFTVIGADGGEYRIYRDGKSGNIRRLNAEKTHEVESYCIHDYDGLPDEDTYIAQMLLLQTDPDAFRRIANATRIRRTA